MDQHIIETLGKTKVFVEDGKVVKVEHAEKRLEYCPVVEKVFGIQNLMDDSARLGVERRIERWGMCTPARKIKETTESFVSFGASEILSNALNDGLIDAAVTVCDGAGTVITDQGDVMQGIGVAMSGLTLTSPIVEVIRNLEGEGAIILDPERASIDQVAGLERAFKDHDCVGVTLTSPDVAKMCRDVEKANPGKKAVLFGVHTTGLSRDDAKALIDTVDLTTGCASRHLRSQIGEMALLQVGRSVPIFAITQTGKELILNRMKHITTQLFVETRTLPELKDEDQPSPLF
ncbi:MAG: methanogenesis marker protein 8 [Candidatus Syntrophoarchaeum caldarius]|uniref:Methanogenesis marker protein 8 n=1 Tax=Candidatus Syntropharchaeum caldarium TaxID=1838285 RepID=A0A1F2P745_9EURY|nr:MAG: methanogenesis marker protein 8 [Candidatus Syntrophoarchaeum caldarius]